MLMVIGAGIALILMALFIKGADTKPEWGRFWMIRPLIVAPIAGAGGGLFAYAMEYFFGYKGGWNKVASITLSLVAFIIALFFAVVLGLDGTLWD